MPTERVGRAFVRLGFEDVGGKKHTKYKGPRGTAPIPRHAHVSWRLVKGILDRLEIPEDEFWEGYK